MTPYYEHAGITIYHGDCREILPGLTGVGAVVTDPPYGIGYESGRDGSLPRTIQGDADTSLRDWMLGLYDEDFPIVAFATWRCVPPRRPRGCLVWHKNLNSMGDLAFPWGGDFELAWVFGHGWAGHRGSAVLRGRTVVTWNSGAAKRLHPHEKPVDLLAQILEKAPPGTILDPFMGSGSTIRAAKDLGRRAIGIEIEERYAEIAAKRLAQEVLFA